MATTEDPRAGLSDTDEWRREVYDAAPVWYLLGDHPVFPKVGTPVDNRHSRAVQPDIVVDHFEKL